MSPEKFETGDDSRAEQPVPETDPAPVAASAPHEQTVWSAEPVADEGPLPVCDYTGESEAPCEEPATVRRWSSAAVITGAVLGAVAGGVFMAAAVLWALGAIPGITPLRSVTSAPRAATTTVTLSPEGVALDVPEAVASKVVPSVVNITIKQTQTNRFTGESRVVEAGNGSGVIIRENGYVLTNNHVVEGAEGVVVTVGVEDKVARVVATDPTTDLAVLKIEGSGYPAIDIGSSRNLRVGQFVMAVGSPFGLEKTVTSGIISALQRSEQIAQEQSNSVTTYSNLIQTDAAINPGNSGGALVDAEGRLVGINTLIQSPLGEVGAAQSAGIGFAIPVDFAVSIADQLISDGKASHPFLGVSTQPVDETVAAQFQLPVKSGALVVFVRPSGPADTAKIKRGDIITKIDETPITGVADVFAAIRLHKIGDTVPVELVRADQKLTLEVTLGSDASR